MGAFLGALFSSQKQGPPRDAKMALSDSKVRTAKPAEKEYKLADDKGLFLLVKTNGGKYWRMKYRSDGKERKLSIGVYPDVTLAQAREARDTARNLVAQGIDASTHKQATKAARRNAAANCFEVVALEWLEKRGEKSEGGDKRLHRLLHKDLFPYIGARPIQDITPPELLQVLRRIESRGAVNTAHRAKQAAGMVFRYAVATGRAERDPGADLKGALATPKATHFQAITDPAGAAVLMRAIHSYQGTPAVMAALKLSPLLFCRPGELRQLEWQEVNLAEHRIEIPGDKMKTGQPHIIPLCNQAMAILADLHPLTGRGRYVFPSARGASRPLSENGVRTALRTMGYANDQMTPHGFRAMARTLLDEILNFPPEWIEHQLAHAVKDANGRAYNRTKHLDQRRRMMQTWADYLDGLREGLNNVVPFRHVGH
jgi:integrase